MAKKSKRKRRKSSGRGAPSGPLTTLLGVMGAEIIGNTVGEALGHSLQDSVKRLYEKATGKEPKSDAEEGDVAAVLLRVLADHGPQSIPDLMQHANVGLTPLLTALQSSQHFKLVEFVGEGEMVKLTGTGTRTAHVVQKRRIRREAGKLLNEQKPKLADDGANGSAGHTGNDTHGGG